MPKEPQEQEQDLDLAKVQDFIRGQVEEYAREAIQQHIPQYAQPQSTPTREQQAYDQLRQTIDPFIRPDINFIQLEAADTRDFVSFYGSNPEASEDKDEVEKLFNEQKAKGRPLPRQDIYHYLQGKKASQDPEGFSKKLTARQKRQLEAASSGVDVGLGALDRARNDPVWTNIQSMPLADLEKALEGITF